MPEARSMSWARALGRSVLGAFLAAAIGSLVTATSMALVMLVTTSAGSDGEVIDQVIKGVVLFVVFGLIIAGVPGLLIGAPIWFAMDRAGLTPRRGAIVGGIVGLVFGIPIFHILAPVCAAGGAFAGWWSVRLVDRWVPIR